MGCLFSILHQFWGTLSLLLVMFTLHFISWHFGFTPSRIENIGFVPDKALTYFTHFLFHSDGKHFTNNAGPVLFLGPFLERKVGGLLYLEMLVFVAVSSAALSAVIAPCYWPAQDNPVGFSGASYFLCVTGAYCIVVMRPWEHLLRLVWVRLPESFRARRWNRACVWIPTRVGGMEYWRFYMLGLQVLAFGLALTVFSSTLASEFANTDESPRLVHSFGAFLGMCYVLWDILRGSENRGITHACERAITSAETSVGDTPSQSS